MTTGPAELTAILDDLLAATGASRTTLRLDWAAWETHVDDVVAEARKPGVASLVGQTSIRQRAAATVRWIDRERRVLVQEDCSTADRRRRRHCSRPTASRRRCWRRSCAQRSSSGGS